jgi:hypothetical protein
MSHIATIKTEIRDRTAIAKAQERLKMPAPRFVHETARVPLTSWHDAAVNLRTGEVRYDEDYTRQFHAFRQAYAVEKTKIEARKAGHTVQEKCLDGGKVRLTINVMGG